MVIYFILFRLLVSECINGTYNSKPSRGNFMYVFVSQFCETTSAEGKRKRGTNLTNNWVSFFDRSIHESQKLTIVS